MEAFVKANAVVRVRRRWLPIVGPTASGVSIFVTGLLVGPDVVFLLLAGMASFLAIHGLWRRWPVVLRGTLRADRNGVTLGGQPLPLRIATGRVESRGARTVVRFDRYLSRVEMDVVTVGEGALFLSALGIDARQVLLVDESSRREELEPTVRRRLDRLRGGDDLPDVSSEARAWGFGYGSLRGHGLRTLFVVGATILVGVGGLAVHPLVGLLGALVVATIGLLRQYVRVHLGADGLRVRRLLGRERYVPYRAIVRLLHDTFDIALETSDGRWISICVERPEVAVAFVARIEDERKKVAACEPADPTTFTRAGRELGEWMNAVTGAMEANASFRTQAVPAETLWRIVEDGAAPPTARAGAALAMRPTLDAEGRTRLRVLAEGSADPRLRVALSTLSAEDDAALEGVLSRVADPR